MERVGILINKLQEQLEQHADAKSMLVTVQMLNSELMQSVRQKNEVSGSKVSVVMPYNYAAPTLDGVTQPDSKPVDKTAAISNNTASISNGITPQIDQVAELIEEKFEEKVEDKKDVATETKRDHTSWIFDPSEAPTFAHQEKVVYELNDSMISGESSLNDKLKIEKIELASVLHDVPIRDLKKAISINDRHRFIEDLFRGDETMYERSIKTINNFNNFAEAEFWMQRELKLKLAWDNNSPQVKLFDQLVRRRFS